MFVVSKGIVDAHGGSISVYSEGEGTGTVFTVELKLPSENTTYHVLPSIPKKVSPGSLSTGLLRRVSIPQALSLGHSVHPTRNINWIVHTVRALCFGRNSIHDAHTLMNFDVNQLHETAHLDHIRADGVIARERDLEINDARCSSIDLKSQEETEEEKKTYEVVPSHVSVSMKYNGAQLSGHLPKLLIVDDSHVCRNMLARALVSRCRVCDEAEDGRQALEMMKASIEADDPYDVVLMDLQMPLVNGSEAAKHMREALGYGGVIIGLTGNALPEDLDAFKSAGADDVLVKPIKVNQFDDAIRNILTRRIQ